MRKVAMLVALICVSGCLAAGEGPFKVPQDPATYVAAMKEVAAKFKGKPGVYLLMGDSITYANQNTAFARGGQHTPEIDAFLKWSHNGERNDLDGYYLAYVDQPGNRSFTAASGMRADQFLTEGKNGLMKLSDMIQKYNPQMALYMLGTNDISGGRPVAQFIADVEKSMDLLMANGTVPILSTLPHYKGKTAQVEEYCKALRELAAKKKLPLVDLYGEMKARAGDNLDGYVQGDGIHLSFATAGGPATEDNLKKDGYLLRCYTTLYKGLEVKTKVFDGK